VFDSVRSGRLVELLIAAQTDPGARRAARGIADHYAIVASDILLFSENAEVQRLFRELARGDPVAIRAVQASADEYLNSVWRATNGSYRSAELRVATGATLWHASSDTALVSPAESPVVLREPLHELATRGVVGMLLLVPRPEALWARDPVGPAFGRTGYGAIIDRRTSRILFHSSASMALRPSSDLFGDDWARDSLRLEEPSGSITYRERDSLRVASFVSLTSPQWTILSSTAVREFADTFSRARRVEVTFLALLTGAVAVAFVVFIGRATRSLENLTRAAAAVGRGELSPELPHAGSDEVGTLTNAFGEMTARVRAMMREIEVSRQLAVLGEFAAQLSHEVRNPLTSLKLDLQGMARQVRAGTLPPSTLPAVESSLREVNRLDSVVRGVLELARQPAPRNTPCCLHEVIDNAVTALHAELTERGITVEWRLEEPMPRLAGDPELLSGMLMNLLINAADAQPGGGRIGVLSGSRQDAAGAQWIDVTIADDGPGVPEEKREEVFRPFFTSRHEGTGLGLALALRTARDHGGSITCSSAPDGFEGAAFVVSLLVPAQ
ncbi:MAG: ATP-binding protein, partial [Gemmatimonadales bacterium]